MVTAPRAHLALSPPNLPSLLVPVYQQRNLPRQNQRIKKAATPWTKTTTMTMMSILT